MLDHVSLAVERRSGGPAAEAIATPVIPIAHAALLWTAITAGETWLGWTG